MNARTRWKSLPPWLRIVAGAALVIFGIVGLFLPIVQGALLVALGLAALARDVPWIRRLLDWVWTSRLAEVIRRRIAGWRRRRSGAGPAGHTR